MYWHYIIKTLFVFDQIKYYRHLKRAAHLIFHKPYLTPVTPVTPTYRSPSSSGLTASWHSRSMMKFIWGSTSIRVESFGSVCGWPGRSETNALTISDHQWPVGPGCHFVSWTWMKCPWLCEVSMTVWSVHGYVKCPWLCEVSMVMWSVHGYVKCPWLCDVSMVMWRVHGYVTETLWGILVPKTAIKKFRSSIYWSAASRRNQVIMQPSTLKSSLPYSTFYIFPLLLPWLPCFNKSN